MLHLYLRVIASDVCMHLLVSQCLPKPIEELCAIWPSML